MQGNITKSIDDNNVMLRVSNLKKRYGDLMAVDGLSFEIYKGEIFGFLGPNGAGKTTSINMICGLVEPTEGEISAARDCRINSKEFRMRLGVCPQENIFWPEMTCLEQLLFMSDMYGIRRKPARTRSSQLLELMGLEEKSNVLAGKLSGGMKRRLNLCLALVHDPEMLVLDEPEAGLDPQSRILVRNYIKTLAKEKTVILTTHNMDEADRLADRVAIIDHGKLLKLDTPENLRKSIGEGDSLEINVHGGQIEDLNRVSGALSEICDQAYVSGTTIVIKGRNLIELVSEITGVVKEQGLKIKNISMRENTLEDVFINLTGRKLRQ